MADLKVNLAFGGGPTTGPHALPTLTLRLLRLLSLFYSDASADGVEERSLVPRSRSRARLRRNATMSYTFSILRAPFRCRDATARRGIRWPSNEAKRRQKIFKLRYMHALCDAPGVGCRRGNN
ncbi:hypothetical protein EVAR_53086_1 [Eumeta japonica]|uniref:Uncharacterized protein n=1 Tax=Eumeta variegata TaxID=151549 RepID=A0A4C1YXA4_EUMVA|nr:hypothetical protein EVAR_53086_1 [Eumeta japonica]